MRTRHFLLSFTRRDEASLRVGSALVTTEQPVEALTYAEVCHHCEQLGSGGHVIPLAVTPLLPEGSLKIKSTYWGTQRVATAMLGAATIFLMATFFVEKGLASWTLLGASTLCGASLFTLLWVVFAVSRDGSPHR